MKIKFRCMKDKSEVEEEPLSIEKLENRNGLFLVTAVHSKCGTSLAKIVGLEEAEKIAKFLGKDINSIPIHKKKEKKGKHEGACDCDDKKDGAHWEDGDGEKNGSHWEDGDGDGNYKGSSQRRRRKGSKKNAISKKAAKKASHKSSKKASAAKKASHKSSGKRRKSRKSGVHKRRSAKKN